MASPACVQSSPGRYLWCSLLSLGFRPEVETANLVGKTNVKYINLGVHMFDKPNKDAFYIVTHFLLDKLDPARFSEAYRHCWPVFDRKADTEFRKITLAWLKDIVDENSKSAPKVLASLFLSPGGPKFIALMLHLAKHVMLQEMKTFTTDGRWVPEEAAVPASTMDIAMKRLKMTKARVLKSALAQDRLLQEDRKRAQTLGQSIQEIRAEGAKYDTLLKRQENESYTEGEDLAQKLLKVRSLWSAIDETLSALKGEQQGVACVLKPDADQSVLDGANLSLKIPRLLLERIEQLPQQLSSGNVYEAGQLNPLCTLELLNHALLLLREERRRVAGPAPLAQLCLHELQTKSGQVARVLEELKVLRLKISKEELPEVRSASRRLEVDWERRWRDALQDKPLASFLSDDPALCFLSPMAPLSFDPAAVSSGVFSCYAAKLPGASPHEEEVPAQGDSRGEFDASSPELSRQKISKEKLPEIRIASRSRSPVSPPPPGRAESPGAIVPSYCGNTSLADLLHTLSSPPKGPSPSPPRPVRQASDKNTHSGCKVAPTWNKTKILDWECDNLASQFAEAITTTSPMDGKRRGLALGDLLGNLGADPFSTRKQLQRTPESLISDVKSSWRKAVEECKVQTSTNQSPAATGDAIATQRTPWHQTYGTPRGPLTFSVNATPCGATPTAAAAACPAPSLTPHQHLRTSPGSPPAWGSPDTELIPHMAGSPDADGRHGVSGTGSSAVHSSATLQPLWTSPGSPPAWGFPDTGGRHSVSGTGSSAVHFSLDDETLPDTAGSDSLLSLSDDDAADGDLLLLSPPTTVRPTSLLDLSNDEASFLGTGTPRCPSTRPAVPGSVGGWLEAGAAAAGAGACPGSDTVFLLDLEALDSLTPPRREYSLPQLVTFSPMDDL